MEMAKAITTNPKKQPHSSIVLGLILRFVVTTLVVKITGNRHRAVWLLAKLLPLSDELFAPHHTLRGCLKRMEMAKAITTNPKKQPHSSIVLGL
jgi:hypothetical protein